MKSFLDQLRATLKKHDRNFTERDLKECCTPAAQTIITYMRQWPTQYFSRNQVVARLMECDRWNDKGQMVLECDYKGKPYPLILPLYLAYERYRYGDQRKQVIPMYNFPSAVKKIPANITPDWEKEIQGLFWDMGRMTLSDFKVIALGQCVKSYTGRNPYCFTIWDRQVSEWKNAQAAIDAFVVTRKGWEHLTSTSIQNPVHAKEMSDILGDILAKADELVEPSVKVIKEENRKLYARQDATRARNDIKTLMAYFKKYGVVPPGELALLSTMIDETEKESSK